MASDSRSKSEESEIKRKAKELASFLNKDENYEKKADACRAMLWQEIRPSYKDADEERAYKDALKKELIIALDKDEEKARRKYITVLKGKKVATQELHYDSFGEGLEPVYFWVLDFLRSKTFMDYEVRKTDDIIAATEASFYYSDIGGKRTAMEKRASEIMSTINMVIKSILNLVWDLKEFKARLAHYRDYFQETAKSIDKEKKETADYALKAIWLTEVDMKKGRGSINMLAQELNFVTVRDAFMMAKSVEDIDKIDLNDRVKRILKPRIKEYLEWVKLSYEELKRRFEIEKSYLKSQREALQTYTAWAKPYIIATHKLLPRRKGGLAEAEAVVGFDIAHIYVNLVAFKEAELREPSTKKVEIVFPKERENEKIYQIVDVTFDHRATPAGVAERGHYYQRGYVRVTFKGYAMSKWDLDEATRQEEIQALRMLNVTDETLEQIDSAVKELELSEAKEGESAGGPAFFEGLGEIGKGVRGIFEPLTSLGKAFGEILPGTSRPNKWDIKRLLVYAQAKAKKDAQAVYINYKKAHGMLDWI